MYDKKEHKKEPAEFGPSDRNHYTEGLYATLPEGFL